jgi:two-component system nitrate/nitrite response regulator NarL
MPSLAVLGKNTLVRTGLVVLLESLGFQHVNGAATFDDLMQQTKGDNRPEIILIALSDGASAPNLMHEIKTRAPITKVVFLSANLDVKQLIGCFVAGASGYLVETISSKGLQISVSLVRAGEIVFPSGLAAVISDVAITRYATSDRGELQRVDLSAQEIRILRQLAGGRPNKVIASGLQIAESTVKVHLSSILRKIHVSNRTQAALWATRQGIAFAASDNAVTPDPAPGDGLGRRSNHANVQVNGG